MQLSPWPLPKAYLRPGEGRQARTHSAAWALAGPARAVAILVVATPCPLILAAPVALVSGLSAAPRRGVVIKSGGVLERLAQCTTLILDETGTLTAGRPEVGAITPASPMS